MTRNLLRMLMFFTVTSMTSLTTPHKEEVIQVDSALKKKHVFTRHNITLTKAANLSEYFLAS
jgi:hypothetical protein